MFSLFRKYRLPCVCNGYVTGERWLAALTRSDRNGGGETVSLTTVVDAPRRQV